MRSSLLETTLSLLTPPPAAPAAVGHCPAGGSQRRLDTQTLPVNNAGQSLRRTRPCWR
ncbi:unnamed protein product [Gulo gulo]|uniref:Uncharacterized protein n=1 Tax=Gulo gulo TaxID=48420 RepID=A0A9X9MAA3_GULGU|nr:unnamed protein product [Gulo gulo]